MAATSQIKEKFEDYDGFVEKFKLKKTTDDCFTPPAVYEAVRAWAFREYADALTEDGMPVPVVRPFFPGRRLRGHGLPGGLRRPRQPAVFGPVADRAVLPGTGD